MTWTPNELIQVFCRPELRSSFREASRNEEKRESWYAGFCAYGGRDSYGSGIDGFDDGYELWGALLASGWTLIDEPGGEQFPYSFQMAYAKDGMYAKAEYCEGDFGVSLYDDQDALDAGVQEFQEWASSH